MINTREILQESMPVLFLCAGISVLSGMFLGRNIELLRMLPGIVIILPAFNAVNGNIASVMSSRLSSALHAGLVKPRFTGSRLLSENVYSMLLVAVASFLVLGGAAAALDSLMGSEDVNLIVFPFVTLTAGLITALILILLSIFSSYLTYRHGVDPDNVVVPALTTIGDLVGISSLLLVAVAVV